MAVEETARSLARYRRLMATGAISALSYAVIEEWVASILPRFIPHVFECNAAPLFVPLLFAFYALAGLLLGAIVAILLAIARGREAGAQRWLSIAITAIYVLHASRTLEGRALVVLVALSLVAAALAWYRPHRASWLVPLILIAPLWFAREVVPDRSLLVKLSGAAAISAVIVTLGIVSRSAEPATAVAQVRFALIVLLTVVTSMAVPPISLSGGRPVTSHRPYKQPNIVLVTLDTVRADHLSLYGYARPTTPELSRFASRATTYTSCIAPGDMTLTSHASLFTGQYAITHGAHHDPSSPDNEQLGMPLPQSAVTLAEVLKRRGYETIAVVANHGYLGLSMNLGQGFTIHDHRGPCQFGRPPRYLLRALVATWFSRWNILSDSFAPPYRRAAEINGAAIRAIDQTVERGAPFFLFINYMDPHRPYVPPSPFDRRFPGKDDHFRPVASHDEIYEQRLRGPLDLSEQEKKHLISQYDGAIAYDDHELGRLFSELQRRDLFENTLIAITSDHGEAFGEKGFIGHGVSVYQDQIDVPLVVKFPQQSVAQTLKSTVSLVDVMPSILQLAGAEIPAGVEGRPLPRTEPNGPRAVFSESYWDHNRPEVRRIERAILLGRWKLVSSTRGKDELYDLARDPHEERDLCSSEPLTCGALRQLLVQWSRGRGRPRGAREELDEETARAFKSLGYIR